MTDAVRSIERGPKDALARTQGDEVATSHEIGIPEADVRDLRAVTGLSQAAFARPIGVRTVTRGRRAPEGLPRVLLALIDTDPRHVQRTLAR